MDHEQPILRKDLTCLPFIRPHYPGDGSIFYLANADRVANKDSAVSISYSETMLRCLVVCEECNFSDYQQGDSNPRKDLHKQGNTIAFYWQPAGKTNFYRFEFSMRNVKTAHYYCKAKNGNFYPHKMKDNWTATQAQAQDIWSVDMRIPFQPNGILPKEIANSRFLLVRYHYGPSSPMPIVTNSMKLPENKILNPKTWNLLAPMAVNDKTKPDADLQTMVEQLEQQYIKELCSYPDTEEGKVSFYLNLLNQLYKACDNPEYDDTFRRLERFSNIPEFWGEDKKLEQLLRDFYGILKFKEHSIFSLIHLIIAGSTCLAEKDLQERIALHNTHEHERLAADKAKKEKKKSDIDTCYLPCFLIIDQKIRKRIKYGRTGPLKYIYEHCPRKWDIKFSTFRKKYDAWLTYIGITPENQRPTPPLCPYKCKCRNFMPD